ncbi:MAG: ribonuclease R [Candidatus Anammoxibacter sp.]
MIKKTDQGAIIKLVHSKRYRPMTASQMAEHFDVSDDEYNGFCDDLAELELNGEIIKIKKDQYAWPKKLGLLVGTLDAKSQGFGFIVPASKDVKQDVYVNEECMGEAMHGDRVIVRLPGRKPGKKKQKRRSDSGKIVEILQHVNESVIGLLKKSKRLNYVVPDNSALFRDIYVSDDDLNGAEFDDKVVIKITQWPTRHLNPEGVITEILGKEDDPGVDIKSIIYQFKLPNGFDETINKELDAIPDKIPADEYKKREDLRKKTVITIDPEDAKDFDDAVSLRKEGDKWFLGVHIADVSFYVKPGTEIDREAVLRGNSIYFPGEVIPMLPEALSNGICSLKEGVDRLTKSAFLTFDMKGNVLSSELKNTVIHVKKRFNYDEVTHILEGSNEDGDSDKPVGKEILSMLRDMKTLGQILFKNRLARGSIELDLPEVDLKLDDNGYITSVEKCTKDISHSIIEEFMLAANEAAANLAHKNKIPCFYRVHEEPEPDDLRDFAYFIKSLTKKKLNPFDKGQLQSVLDDVRGKPESYAVNLMLLRSFMRAEYSIKQHEHYALAIENYAHFTSPIRRYPDLIVHRALDRYFDKKASTDDSLSDKDVLKELTKHCSFTERRAEEAEREIIKTKLIRHIEDRVDEDFDGVITGVEEYGFFIQLQENLLEGLVHVKTLDDFYILDKKNMTLKGERKRKTYRIGDKIRVRICRVDKIKKQVDFKVIK